MTYGSLEATLEIPIESYAGFLKSDFVHDEAMAARFDEYFITLHKSIYTTLVSFFDNEKFQSLSAQAKSPSIKEFVYTEFIDRFIDKCGFAPSRWNAQINPFRDTAKFDEQALCTYTNNRQAFIDYLVQHDMLVMDTDSGLDAMHTELFVEAAARKVDLPPIFSTLEATKKMYRQTLMGGLLYVPREHHMIILGNMSIGTPLVSDQIPKDVTSEKMCIYLQTRPFMDIADGMRVFTRLDISICAELKETNSLLVYKL